MGESEKSVCAILLAAGSSTRMGRGADGARVNKLLMSFGGLTPVERCALAFCRYADEFVIVVSEDTREAAFRAAERTDKPVRIVAGGERRQDSVLAGITATDCDIVAIHDCARFLVSGAVIEEAIASAKEKGSGAAAVNVRDTLRKREEGSIVDRSGLVSMQTPQCFDRSMLLEAYDEVVGEATDDAAVWQAKFGPVCLTKGSLMNQKLTEAEDVGFFRAMTEGRNGIMRIGIGEDTHRLTEGRRLVLGGVEIPFELGLLGHSDADALIHAIIDAMLGAAALGDIGGHFPDKDPAYKDISSLILLEKASGLLEEAGYEVVNIDATITAQQPKLAPYIPEMRKKIAEAISRIGIEDVSIKATTPEGLGPEGSLQSITVRAVCGVVRLG
jgi:2-C-methyl-D-erythritol 4-phosphate cytidylyltransferase/2-C-methyl-D-erythritol 2,4-cyclodiphosphate synthase